MKITFCSCIGFSCYVSPAPQVRITPVPEARRLQTLLAGMPLLLECEVSVLDVPIFWFKDGNPVALDDGALVVQSEGCIHRLLIPSVCSLDSGVYTCSAGEEDAISFAVTVNGEWEATMSVWAK